MKTTVAILLFPLLAVAGCGDDSLNCPAGYKPGASGKSCVPILRDAGQDPDVPRDVGEPPIQDVVDVVPTPDTAPETDGATTDIVDVGPPIDVPEPTGAVGDPCQAPRDCQDDMTCLGWPSGYCSRQSCALDGDDCPEGSHCLTLYGDSTACFKGCEDVYDCRWWTGDYACKTVAGAPELPRYPDGAPTRVCVGLEEETGGNGASCATHSACEGELACVQSLPGGNCLQLFCEGPLDCVASGSACVSWDGLPTCMQTCAGDPDCTAWGDGTMVCSEMETLGQNDVDVCASGTSGLDLGASCLSDFECDSSECQTLGSGLCQLEVDDLRLPCFTQEDCPTGYGTCQPVAPPVGVCSANCEIVGVCPGGSGCVREGDDDAMCRPSCTWSGSHAYHDCLETAGGAETGWDCVYGIPHGNEDLDGFYCATLRKGQVGSPCDDVTDCDYDSPICWEWPDAPADLPGYCARSCGPQSPCPFGTYCFQTSSGARCLKLCASALDCEEGYDCGYTSDISGTSADRKICLLP